MNSRVARDQWRAFIAIDIVFPTWALLHALQRFSETLPMREGAERFGELYLVFAEPDFPTASAVRMAEILRADVAALCPPLTDQVGGSQPRQGQ